MEILQSRKLVLHVFIVCALGLFIDGYDLYISSIAEPFLQIQFHPSPFIRGLTQAATPMGAALGAIIIGRLADIIGRRVMLLLNLIFFVVIAILSALAWDSTSLCVLRFLIGFGVGADYPICAAYLSEMSPPNKRNSLFATAMLINCAAAPIGVLIAWIIFKIYPHQDAWRFMFATGAIPAVLGLLLRMQLPESFVWKATQRLQSKTRGTFAAYKALFSPTMLKITIGLCGSWFLQDISYYAIILFTPSVLAALNLFSEPNFITSANEILKYSFFVNSFVLLGAFASIFAIKRIDHVVMQKTGFMVAFFGLMMLTLSNALPQHLQGSIVLMGYILFNFFINFGPGITTYLLPTEYYPTAIRATGHGLASGIGKLGAFVGTIFLPILQEIYGIHFVTFVLAVTLLLGFIASYLINDTTETDLILTEPQYRGDYELPIKQSAT